MLAKLPLWSIVIAARWNTFCVVFMTRMRARAQVVNVLGFSLPFYRSPTLLLSLGLSVRVLYYLITQRPDVIHVSSPGLLVFAATLYAKLLAIPLVVRAHTFPCYE